MEKKNAALFEFLERSRALRTLLSLLNAENKGLDQLLREIGGSKSTGMARINELVKLKLVTKRASLSEKRKMFYYLTDKGKILANQIKKAIDDTEE